MAKSFLMVFDGEAIVLYRPGGSAWNTVYGCLS